MSYRRICRSARFGIAAAAAMILLFPALASAQTEDGRPKRKGVTFEGTQVGFGSNPGVALFKSGAWTPVYILLKAAPGGTDTPGDVIIEAADGDEVHTKYRVSFPQLNPEEVYTVLGYTKPGRTDFNYTIVMNDKVVGTHHEEISSMNPGQLLFLTLGSNMQLSLRPALNPKQKGNNNEEETDNINAHEGRSLVATVDMNMLPRTWFAYEPVDLAILTTGNRDGFVMPLLNEREGRKEALAEWVRRGGKLLISVGRNQDLLRGQEFEAITSLLPVAVNGTTQVTHLHSVERYGGGSDKPMTTPRAGKFEVAKLEAKPGRVTDTLLYWNPEERETPLVVRGAYGLGSVTVVAFDLDEPPFRGWKGQQGFLNRLVRDTTPAFAEAPVDEHFSNRGFGYNQQFTDIGGSLETALEQFDEIPVISFGWVALFILIYILVVGPLDYFFLKKVVKRLELTWITFPTVVIAISVAAYFTAYWLKGNDQKINKVDLVDIDLSTQQVYGNSWFTIFSPRIQHYTVGLEPVEPEWGPAPADRRRWPVLVSWMPRQETNFGQNRGQSQGLFRRPYAYADDATGLVGVPIQVWSTKSFATSWQASFDPAKPLFSSDLKLTPRGQYTGTITSRLPVPLEEA
ncbi:MAG TPA: hypothetical protein VGY58_11885, partial [Gemmataceae bacterium]|nr:hypothetical protein [Gemmataceae bacterium]